MVLITIIIPIYNSERFLSKCLESIRNQTYQSLEIILIDDGSTDQSSKICEEYLKRDKRFQFYHKENGGVSSARNLGLEKATGDFIGFIDPDDWVEAHMFEKLIHLKIKYDADISICGYFKEEINGTSLKENSKDEIFKLNQVETFSRLLDTNDFGGYLWNKLFTRKTLKKNNIKFDENIHFCEDLLFCCEVISKSKEIVYDSSQYYHYIVHDSNIAINQYSLKKISALNALINIIELLSEIKDLDTKKYKSFFMKMTISLIMNGMQEKKEVYQLKKNLYKYKISDLNGNFLKFSCFLARMNIQLCYYLWKILK